MVRELSTNLARHAKGGQILALVVQQAGASRLQIIALDRGPWMSDISRYKEDGYSTGGTRGTGLGAVLRQTDFHDLVSFSGVGTIHFSEYEIERDETAESAIAFAAIVCRPRGNRSAATALRAIFETTFQPTCSPTGWATGLLRRRRPTKR